MKNLEEWRKEVHALAVEKGWWGKIPDLSPTSVLAKLALIVSELSEAIEIVREPDFDPKFVWMAGVQGTRISYATDPWSTTKPVPKPEGFGTEIADAVIRILDLMGALNMNVNEGNQLEKLRDLATNAAGSPLTADEILASIMRITSMFGMASGVVDDHPPASWGSIATDLFHSWMSSAILTLYTLSARTGVDLGARIAEKHAYNVTRENRHGGKRA